jgi:hypothetical protein
MIARTDLAWVAGVFDLKHSAIRRANDHTRRLVLPVQDSDFAIIKRISDLSGSNVTPRTTTTPLPEWMRRACSDHCKDKHIVYEALPRRHEWKLNGISAAIILYNVLPYMIHRKDIQLEGRMWETIKTTPYTGGGSTTCRVIIRKLSGLGWGLPDYVMDRVFDLESVG